MIRHHAMQVTVANESECIPNGPCDEGYRASRKEAYAITQLCISGDPSWTPRSSDAKLPTGRKLYKRTFKDDALMGSSIIRPRCNPAFSGSISSVYELLMECLERCYVVRGWAGTSIRHCIERHGAAKVFQELMVSRPSTKGLNHEIANKLPIDHPIEPRVNPLDNIRLARFHVRRRVYDYSRLIDNYSGNVQCLHC